MKLKCAATALSVLLLPALCRALQPLKTVYHYLPEDGGWLGPRVPDHEVEHLGHRRLAVVAASLFGDVALTTASGSTEQGNGDAIGTCDETNGKCSFVAGENVYGPLEAGFSSLQDEVITNVMGCSTPSACYSEGGIDVATAEAICAFECGITLPRSDTTANKYYAFLDTCGGHTVNYHFHRELSCLYTDELGSGHSAQVAEVENPSSRRRQLTTSSGERDSKSKYLPPTCPDGSMPKCPDGSIINMGDPPCNSGSPVCDNGSTASDQDPEDMTANGELLYGKWENFATEKLPELDACGGHYGMTPDSIGEVIYHYHVQQHPPFTLGCIGPNEDGSLVSVQQCRDLYSGCSETDNILLVTVKNSDGTTKVVPYQATCPCWDASGKGLNGAGLNVGNVAATRSWYTRKYENGTWVDDETGTFATHPDVSFQNGFQIVELPAVAAARSNGTMGTTKGTAGMGTGTSSASRAATTALRAST